MAGTYSQIYIQCVFAVKNRDALLELAFRDKIFTYMAGIINAKGHKAIIVNGTADHVHLFMGLRPNGNISDLIREVKNGSSKFINEQGFLRGIFNWQEGYGVFSYSHSKIDAVYKYVANQEEHHKKITFKEEYIHLLNQFEIEFNEKFLFDWIE